MIIKIPEVNIYASEVAYDTFMEQYNLDIAYNRDMLKSTHLQLFSKIIKLSQRQMKIERNILIKSEPSCLATDSSKPYVLSTNSTFLAKVLKCKTNTVRNRIKRLIESGAIVNKVNHGRENNYEIHINPEILLINDVNNPRIISNSPYIAQALKSPLGESQTKIFVPSINKRKKLNTNKVMNVKGVSNSINENSEGLNNVANGVPNSKNGSRTSNQKTEGKHLKLKENSINIELEISDNSAEFEEKKEKSSAKKEESKAERLATYRNRIARWIVAYAINLLWKDKDIYEAEIVKTVQYIEDNYLKNANFSQLPNIESEFKWRIHAVERYIKRKNYNLTQYPFQYFDKNNTTSGFANTKKWYNNAKFYYQRKETAKNKRSDFQKLHDSIRRYTKDRTLVNFRKEEQYVKNNIPDLHDDFLMHIRDLK